MESSCGMKLHMSRGGFYSDQQAANFEVARTAFQRGRPSASVCGARTRNGSLCQAAPIRGHVRCIRHCGPKAAQEYRERQRRAFLRGRISAAEWFEAEAKRARNRLRDAWKKDPWLSGCTIDLGSHETGLADAMQAAPRVHSELAPAVLDWCRWRYRRLQIDRRDDRAWLRCLMDELPRRVLAAGPAPEGWTQPVPDTSMAIKLDAVDASSTPSSKRWFPDAPRPEKVKPVQSVRGRGRPRRTPLTDDEAQALALTAYRHRAVLAPLLDRCTSQSDRDVVLRALHGYVQDAESMAKMQRWHEIVRRLG